MTLRAMPLVALHVLIKKGGKKVALPPRADDGNIRVIQLMPGNVQRGKYWCFTLNNPTEEEEAVILAACVAENSPINYLVFGREVGESGTPHFQGYVEFKNRKTLGAAKALLGQRLHLEKRRGTSQEASDYCAKEDHNPYVFGTLSVSEAGRRSDLESALNDVREGSSIFELWQSHPTVMVRYEKAMKRAKVMLGPRQVRECYPLENFKWNIIHDWSRSQLLWGEPGIGKTEYARSLLPKALFVSHKDMLVDYDPEIYEGIIFDDMSFTHEPRSSQIHLVDQDNERSIHCRYQCALIPAHTKKLFLSNIRDIFDLADGAIKRRVQVHNVLGRGF